MEAATTFPSYEDFKTSLLKQEPKNIEEFEKIIADWITEGTTEKLRYIF